ncbi:MAG: hypothetical protein CMJ61_04120, partial [Planctomycetaceae bacterium]|nr:hypothetical protein [Planctomycetaceae bacterium]
MALSQRNHSQHPGWPPPPASSQTPRGPHPITAGLEPCASLHPDSDRERCCAGCPTAGCQRGR